MNQNEAINVLKTQAAKDPCTNAVLHMFALRERARHQVTLQALKARMEREQFKFEDSDYVRLLKLMASVGFGKLVTSAGGKVKALVEIRTTLQSIGAAACGQKTKLIPHKQRNRYVELPKTRPDAPQDVPAPPAPEEVFKPASGAVAGFPVSITVLINGKPVNFRIPKDLTEAEIANLVVRFRDKAVL